MTKHCASCGSSVEVGSTVCHVCHVSMVRSIRLEGPAGRIEASVATDVGQVLLKRVIGDDARFAGTIQFRLERDHGGAWVVRAVPEAKNPTFVNGHAVPDSGARLADGDQLSLAGKAGQLTVRFVMET